MSDNNPDTKKIPMRELVKLTNMSRATINFYIKEGVLPIPHKSAKNMAYYDEDFIEKLKFVERMRNSQFTLNQIRKLINLDKQTVTDFNLQVLDSVNTQLTNSAEDLFVSRDQLTALGLGDELLHLLMGWQLILPIDKEGTLFPVYSMTLCRFIKYYIDKGIPLPELKGFIDKLLELADIEKNIFVNYIRTPMIQENLSLDEQKKEVQTCIENINGLLPLLHLQFMKQANENLRKAENEK